MRNPSKTKNSLAAFNNGRDIIEEKMKLKADIQKSSNQRKRDKTESCTKPQGPVG